MVRRASLLLDLRPAPAILCIDIPIGLSESGARECDRLARSLLGSPRCSSVFPAPIRPALRAVTRDDASRITHRIDGRRVSAQAWQLYPKIREVDALLASGGAARVRVVEVHPELSFRAWNECKAIREGKRTPTGAGIRVRLAEEWLGPDLLHRARGSVARSEAADDDVLDAVAALWTAVRFASGDAVTLPQNPPTDALGLPMAITY
jgi:predicted RNase H-like nuclease